MDILAPSVEYLRTTFLAEVLNAGFSRDSTIYEIENLGGPPGVIRRKGLERISPLDGRKGSSYVHCLRGKRNVGVANYMLSYTWG